MDEHGEQTEHEPKISTVEIILIGAIFSLIDAVEIAALFFALDDFWTLDAVAATIFFYLFLKGIPPLRQFIAWVIELVPWLGALPMLTAGWIWTVWADRHPDSAAAKALQVASVAGGIAKSEYAGGTAAGAGAKTVDRANAAVRAEEAGAEIPAGTEAGKGSGVARGAGAEADIAEKTAPGEPRAAEVSEEAMGVEKEPLEKVREVMEKLPEPETQEDEESEEDESEKETPRMEDIRRREIL